MTDTAPPKRSWQELFRDLEAALRIDENHLERDVIDQPVLFYEIGRMLALEISRRDAAKLELEEIKARVDAEVRRDIADQGAAARVREAEVSGQVLLDADVKQATETLRKLGERVGRCAALKEAYVQRSYMLREMVALHLKDYYGELPVRGGVSHAEEKARRAREALDAARRAAD